MAFPRALLGAFAMEVDAYRRSGDCKNADGLHLVDFKI